ncbi:MAG: hypothetical protein ACK4NU_13595 [Brevundimonas sp.]
MSISSVSGFLGAMGTAGTPYLARQEKPASTLDRDLDKIREKGFQAWAQEERLEKLKDKIRQELLTDKKLTEDDLAAMPEEQRLSIEAEIEDIIAKMIEEAIRTAVEDAIKEGKTQGVVLDISV